MAAFFGASQLTSHRFLDPVVIVPLLGGLAAIVVLVVYQYRAKRPLLTIRTMLTSTMPVAGISVALFAAAASVSATVLTAAALAGHYSPLHIGVLYLPEVAGAVITAVVLGLVITKRAMHYLPLVGMVFLAAGILVFAVHVPSSQAATLVGSGLTGIGLGATVAPALFVAGFSLPSANLQRVFAIVELLRAVAAFMVAPIFVYFAANRRQQPGSRDADRALDRLRARRRRRARRRGSLRARRRPPADPRPRALPRGRAPGLVLPAAAGESPRTHRHDTGRDRKRRLTWHPRRPEAADSGPVLFAYDGSELAQLAIEQAGGQLAPGRDGTRPLRLATGRRRIRARRRPALRRPERDRGAGGARSRPPPTEPRWRRRPGSGRRASAVEAAPTWKGIVETAEERNASLIVLGSHRRSGLVGHLLGSVAAAVVTHSASSVLVVHQRS